jgi:hypothetical protein
MKIKLFTLLSLVVLFFAACKKDKKEEQSPLIGSWKKVKIESKTSTTNWVTDNRTCYDDDVEEYSDGGAWASYDGTKQCSAGTGIIKGTWKLAVNNTKIIYTYQGYTGEYESTVETLTATSLVLTQSTGDVKNTQVRTTYQK